MKLSLECRGIATAHACRIKAGTIQNGLDTVTSHETRPQRVSSVVISLRRETMNTHGTDAISSLSVALDLVVLPLLMALGHPIWNKVLKAQHIWYL